MSAPHLPRKAAKACFVSADDSSLRPEVPFTQRDPAPCNTKLTLGLPSREQGRALAKATLHGHLH